MRLTQKILTLIFFLLSIQGVWAIDADSDGSDSYEEGLAGTSDSDPAERPYWWKTLFGDSEEDYLGRSVSGAGDVNGDGHADVIVGAAYDDDNGSDSGSARVLSGADGSILYTFYGDGANDLFGSTVSGAGDVNGDGYADLIVGAPLDSNNGFQSGSARVFSGVDGSILYTFNGNSALAIFGTKVSGAGDVNGDGYADLVVGAYGTSFAHPDTFGSARVFSGADGSTLFAFNEDNVDDYFGRSVSGAGDVNGDGYADLIVGAGADDDNGADSGSARVYSGADGSVLYTFNGDSAGDFFGVSVSGAGDVNDDTYADLIVGAHSNGTNPGFARVFSGADGSILYTFNGDGADEWFGMSVSGAGDVNGDSHADLIVGAGGNYESSTVPGSARVFSGADGSTLYILNGESVGDAFGVSVSGAGDVNGDGYADLVVGAFGDDNNGAYSGSARVFLSSDLMSDIDLDYRLNAADNCPSNPNTGQADQDDDGIGNKCDEDFVPFGC